MSKTMKKIGTIFAAATLVGATLTGAIAADLKDLPAPFVKDGKADVTIVVGASAATADVLGSIDIASALQAASVTTETVTVAGSKSSTVADGAKVETSGNSLLLNEDLDAVEASFDDSDLPELLADGIVTEEDDNNDFDYTQELALGADIQVEFDADDTDMDDPLLFLDLDTASSDILWNYSLEFKGGQLLALDELEDSETVVMLGKTFTFAPNIAHTGEITLYGSDKTEYMTLNEPKTFTVDGKTYTVEITGGNSDNDNVVIAVNGVSKTVTEGESVTVNGLELFAKDVFVTNIPTLSAAATLFVGSQEIVLQQASAAPSYSEVEIGGESVNGLEAWVKGANNGNVSAISFVFTPAELAGDIAGFDEANWLESGDSVVDPLFGTFEVLFNGGNYALEDEAKSTFKLNGGSDELSVEFVNDDDVTTSFTPFKLNGSAIATERNADGTGFGLKNAFADGDSFILQDSATTPILSQVFEVTSFTTEDSEQVVRLKNLGTGKTESYGAGDEIVDGTTVLNVNGVQFNLSAASSDKLYLKGGESYLNLNLSYTGNWNGNTTHYISLVEANMDEAANVTRTFALAKDSSDAEVEVSVGAATGSGAVDGDADDGNDFQYYLSEYGTYLVAEIDENDYVMGYVPADEDGETHYEVFFAPTGSAVSASGSTVTTTKVNPIAVGTAVLDSSVSLASETKNLIVVGGPCANSVAAALLKSDAANCVAGFTPGKAVVQLFDTPKGKVAMLVAGYEAIETQAASRAVALMDSRLVGKSVTLTVTSTSDFDISASQ